MPFAVSPVVAGYMLLLLFGRNGILAPVVETLGIQVAFAMPGMVLATLFVTLPFMIRELIPVLEAFDTRQEKAAATLGASGWQTFWRVTFPALRWGMIYGITLTFARALGEFGAVLVIGGAGYIGSISVEELLNAGHAVTVYDDLTEGHRSAVDPRAKFVHNGLGEAASLKQAVRNSNTEAVMHFAANALVGESMINPGKYFRNNVACGLNLLDAAVACGVKKFVFSSTCATYGSPDRVPMTEDLPQRPINPYGHTKLAMEWALRDSAVAWGLGSCALRYFNACGAVSGRGEAVSEMSLRASRNRGRSVESSHRGEHDSDRADRRGVPREGLSPAGEAFLQGPLPAGFRRGRKE